MTQGKLPEARCKCRKCGVVSTAREWNVAPGGGACPHCGHGAFSIAFDRPAAPQALAPVPVRPQAVDAHGRHRRVVRREDFEQKPAAPAPGAAFAARLRKRMGLPPEDE